MKKKDWELNWPDHLGYKKEGYFSLALKAAHWQTDGHTAEVLTVRYIKRLSGIAKT